MQRFRERGQNYLMYARNPVMLLNKSRAKRDLPRILSNPTIAEVRHWIANYVDASGERKNISKYIDLDRYLLMNLRRIYDLRLDKVGPSKILDLGAGAGYFMYLCKVHGHQPMGIDLPEHEFYNQMIQLFGLERIAQPITAFEPLPVFDRKFDFVTSFATCFHQYRGDKHGERWSEDAWAYFLHDIFGNKLTPNGIVHLHFHDNPKGSFAHTHALLKHIANITVYGFHIKVLSLK
jgi:hypothetical protein